ncbi:restriction endonuclease subunit S [Sphingobacterium sp. WM]|uniref:restriction endonuclease subunit S n=1 Tax=Sphingobacterium sp. WM TaxID=3031802 RepID=UPI00240E700D|nr:restriction endonuclease subunit S [Sphingobacterium sp. WM]WFB62120.1 restriction endonuclease subunit S [Sphingobacterium sp. WM]
MQTYDSYKESGIDWLGEIPNHWELKRIKHLYHIGRGRVIAQTELVYNGKYPVYSSQTLNNGILGYINTFDFNDEILTWTTDGANAGTVFLRRGKFNCTNVCGTLKPFTVNNLDHNLYSLSYVANYYKRPDTNGAKIMNNEMAEIVLPLPPISEQEAIAAFLDEKCGKIDILVSVKEQQIALLKERRQMVIHKAVTKGNQPNVEMKYSGIDWIGEIPKHWEVKRLKYIFRILKRIAGQLGYDVLSITQKGIKVKDITSGEGQLAMDYSKYQYAFKGDFAMNHMDLLTGWVDISSYNGVISPDYRVFELINKNNIDKYFLQLLQDCYRNKTFYAHGQGVSMVGRWRFPTENFNNFYFPIPPISEQEAIVAYLEEQTGKIDQAITLKTEQIAKLKAYKQSLINEVVTGKVKVA